MTGFHRRGWCDSCLPSGKKGKSVGKYVKGFAQQRKNKNTKILQLDLKEEIGGGLFIQRKKEWKAGN